MLNRSRKRDGFRNRLEFYLLTRFGFLWPRLETLSPIKRWLNRFIINDAVEKTGPRPLQFSLRSDYTSWDSLTDRTFTGRHLPPADDAYIQSLPSIDAAAELFRRPSGKQRTGDKSTLLFSHFAQWFTDGFLRTDRNDFRKNTSNHELDLSPLYGLNRQVTTALRAGTGGRLKSQIINGEEWAPYYFGADGNVKPEFAQVPILLLPGLPADRKALMFATGVERGNNQVGYVMLNTLFLREHNRICGLLAQRYSIWDDERLFQVARNILIVVMLRIVVEEYINHITPYYFKFVAQPASFWNEPWYRTNWMTIEFNLLYRWHGLVADNVCIAGIDHPVADTLFNNQLLIQRGLGPSFDDASNQAAGDIGPFNTNDALMDTEKASLLLGRLAKLRSYNEYRKLVSYPPVDEFDQITGDPGVQAKLRELYGTADRIELYAGLFAEDRRLNSALSPLIGRMVGIDAFSQALTCPLLSIHVFKSETFSEIGWQIIQATNSLSQLVERNTQGGPFAATMTRRDWKRIPQEPF